MLNIHNFHIYFLLQFTETQVNHRVRKDRKYRITLCCSLILTFIEKISLLRSLGVSVANIPELVNKGDSLAFWKIIDTQQRDLHRRKEQNDLLKELASSLDWNAVKLKAAAAECRIYPLLL